MQNRQPPPSGSGDGKPAVVCLNRDRRDQLWREHMELQRAERARTEAAQQDALVQHLGDIGPRELALLTAAILRAHQHEPTTALALRRLHPDLLTRKGRLLDDHLALIQALAQITPSTSCATAPAAHAAPSPTSSAAPGPA